MTDFSNLFDFNGRENRQNEITSICEQTFDLFDDATTKVFDELKEELSGINTKSTELYDKLSKYD